MAWAEVTRSELTEVLLKKSNNTGFVRGVAEAPKARGEARRALG